MIAVPHIDVPFVMTGATARRQLNAFKRFTKSSAIQLSNPDMNIENLLIPEADWLILHPLVDAAGVAVLPTSRLPQRPEDLADNATNTQVTIHAIKTTIADRALVHSKVLKAVLLQIIGTDIASEIEHFNTGHELIPIWFIYKHMIDNYGIKTSEDINYFRNELKSWNADKPVSTNAARIRNIFTELAPLGMYISEVDRVFALVEASQNVPSISTIVMSYMSLHPTLASQTFSSLVTYITQQLPLAMEQTRIRSAAAKIAASEASIASLHVSLATAHATIAELVKKSTSRSKKWKLAPKTVSHKPNRNKCEGPNNYDLAHREITQFANQNQPIPHACEIHTISCEPDSFNHPNRIIDDGMAAGPLNGDHIATATTGSLNNSTSFKYDTSKTPIHDCGATNTISEIPTKFFLTTFVRMWE